MIIAHNAPEIPPQSGQVCGWSFDPLLSAPFDPRRSSILDWLLIVEENLSHLKRAIEQAENQGVA